MITHRQVSDCFQLLAANIQAAMHEGAIRKEEQYKDEMDSILHQAGFQDAEWSEDIRQIRCEARDMQDNGRRTTFIYEKSL